MLKLIFPVYILLLFGNIKLVAQKLQLELIAETKLNKDLFETSGITSINCGKTFWTHNDGGNFAKIFEIDSSGNILRTVQINNVKNIDWEDIIYDNKNSIYIADIGNNSKKRDTLFLHKINVNDILSRDDVDVETYKIILNSKFSRQDFEALILKNDTIFLFSKNWTKGISFHSQVFTYSLQNKISTLQYIKTLRAKNHFLPESQITSAAFDPTKDKVYLLSSTSIVVFRFSDLYSTIKTKLKFLPLKILGQHEGIYFYENRFVINQESNKTLKKEQAMQFYKLTLKKNLH
jgi:uncharacterized protein YjiK